MVGQQPELFLYSFGVESLPRLGHATVQRAPGPPQECVVSRNLGQDMLKGVLDLGHPCSLADHLCPLQCHQMVVQADLLCDRGQYAVGKAAPDHGSQLDDLAGLYDQVLGSLELNRQRVEMEGWLSEVLVPWETAAKEKDLEWQVQMAEQLPSLLVDPDRLAQAVGNLCSNALKFTPSGGQVMVLAGVDQGRFWIRVKDNGPGILPQDQVKVFEPFYRGPHDRRIRQGMGLGLTIARDIIHAHQGEIELKSEVGKGSEFTINIPL